MKKDIKFKLTAVFLTVQLMTFTACGNDAVIESEEGIPSMTRATSFGYIEMTGEPSVTTVQTRPGFTPPDMTGTELATTYTDEYGNVYGITETVTEEELPSLITTASPSYPELNVITSAVKAPFGELPESSTYDTGIDLSAFPDVQLSEYYKNTDPANTVTFGGGTLPAEETTAYTTAPYSYSTPATTPVFVTQSSETTTASYTESTVSETVTTAPAVSLTNKERAESRNAVVPSKYRSGANEVMHTYSYYSLTDTQKYAYDVITSACLDYEDKVTFSLSDRITFDDLFTAYQMLYLDEVRLYYIDTTMEYIIDNATDYVTEMNLCYIYDKQTVDSMNSMMQLAADEILKDVNGMSEYETVKHIHDEIIKRCTYTLTGNDITSPYGAMVKNKAQCQGYARAFSYLCNLCGIETDIVLGVANEEHMWNMAKIGGKWYHVDLTWDDPDKESYPDSIRYDYFCVSTDRMEELRTIEGNSHELPLANSDDLEYYNYNGLVVSSVKEAQALFIKEAVKASETKASTVQFRCSSSEVYEAILASFFNDSNSWNVLDLADKANEAAVNKINTNSISHNTNFDTLIVKIFLDYV